MVAHLGLLLFSTILRTAVSLQCEVCSFQSTSCNGFPMTCSTAQDTCVVGSVETTVGGVTAYDTLKSCGRSAVCKQEPIVLNYGQGRTQRNGIACCAGGACSSIRPTLPPFNTTTNGKQCPGCISTGSCPDNTVQCTGFDDYCFQFVVPGAKVTAMGCAKKAACDILKATAGRPGGMAEVDCQLAGKASLPPRSLLLALSGLLWMKTLF